MKVFALPHTHISSLTHMYFRTQYVNQLCGNGTTVTEILQILTLISVPKRKYFIHILKTHTHICALSQ